MSTNDYTASGPWSTGGDPLDDTLKAMRDMREKQLGPPPPSPFDVCNSLWKMELIAAPTLPDDEMLLFSRPFGGIALLAHPKHFVRVADVVACGLVGEELRCGPFTTPSGKQWAVVRDRDTGRRSVVDWPRPVWAHCSGGAA